VDFLAETIPPLFFYQQAVRVRCLSAFAILLQIHYIRA